MARVEEEVSRHPPFLSPIGTALGGAGFHAGHERCHLRDRMRPRLLLGLERCWCPWGGGSAPSRMGLEEGRATARREMWHSRVVAHFTSLGPFGEGPGEIGAPPCPEQAPVPASGRVAAIPGVVGLNCMTSTAQSSPTAWHHMCLEAGFLTNHEKKRVILGYFGRWARL